MDEKEINKRLDKAEKEIEALRKDLNIIAEENNILRLDLADTLIEKVKVRNAKKKIYQEYLEEIEKYENHINEEYKKTQEIIEGLQETNDQLCREKKILLSERSNGLLKEVLKQARTSKKRTGENPFELLE